MLVCGNPCIKGYNLHQQVKVGVREIGPIKISACTPKSSQRMPGFHVLIRKSVLVWVRQCAPGASKFSGQVVHLQIFQFPIKGVSHKCTLGTTLGQFLTARLAPDSLQYRVQGHKQHVKSVHLDTSPLPVQSFHPSGAQICKQDRHGTFAGRMSGTWQCFGVSLKLQTNVSKYYEQQRVHVLFGIGRNATGSTAFP